MRNVALTVNGTRHELELEPRELLVYVLRERLGLTGTNVGCDTSSCGSCTVLVDGASATVSLIDHGEATSEAAIREGLEGNLCRCTGYHNIVVAVQAAAAGRAA